MNKIILTQRQVFIGANGDYFIQNHEMFRGLDNFKYHNQLFKTPTTKIYYGQKYIIH